MIIRPGAKKFMKEKPNTSPLSLPSAKESTDKNNKLETRGEKSVWAHTTINLLTSFMYRLLKPIQLIRPNFLTPISYFFTTIDKYFYISFLIFVNIVNKTII